MIKYKIKYIISLITFHNFPDFNSNFFNVNNIFQHPFLRNFLNSFLLSGMIATNFNQLQHNPIDRLSLKPIFGSQILIKIPHHIFDSNMSFDHYVFYHLPNCHSHTCDLIANKLTQLLQQYLSLLLFLGPHFNVLHNHQLLSPTF